MKNLSLEEVRKLNNKYENYKIFPFKFVLNKDGNIFKPVYYLDSKNRTELTKRSYKSSIDFIPIGYCKFKRENGILKGRYDYYWNTQVVYVYQNPPKIGKDEFIIKTTKSYDDISLGVYSDYACKFEEL